MTDTPLCIQGLAIRFGDQTVLEGIDLDLHAGTILGYVGSNGAGKTCTLRAIVGLLQGFEGRITVNGHDIGQEPDQAQAGLGYVPERGAFYETLTLAETLLLAGRLHGMADELIRARAAPLLDLFDLSEHLPRRLGTFSKGMRQKALLIQALLHDPRLLVLDEPLSGLDVMTSRTVRRLLRAWRDRGRAILVTSHVMTLLEELCDEVAVLHQGALLARGSVDDIKRELQARSLEALVASLSDDEVETRQAHLDQVLDAFAE